MRGRLEAGQAPGQSIQNEFVEAQQIDLGGSGRWGRLLLLLTTATTTTTTITTTTTTPLLRSSFFGSCCPVQ